MENVLPSAPDVYCLHTGELYVYDLLGDGILLGGACPAESTHTAFISTISSPSTTLTSSVPVILGLLTHCLNFSMVAGSILYSLYTLDGSDPAGNAFSRSSRDIRRVAVRWLGGGAADVEVNSSVRALRVRCACAGYIGKSTCYVCMQTRCSLPHYRICRRH